MTVEATFNLTPRESHYFKADKNRSFITVYGAHFWPRYYEGYEGSFEGLYKMDQLMFSHYHVASPTLDYTKWGNTVLAPHIELHYDLTDLGEDKELSLVFGYKAWSEARLLIFSRSEQLGEEKLLPGDSQFMIEVECLDSMEIFFIHVSNEDTQYGGNWFFKGITGYVV